MGWAEPQVELLVVVTSRSKYYRNMHLESRVVSMHISKFVYIRRTRCTIVNTAQEIRVARGVATAAALQHEMTQTRVRRKVPRPKGSAPKQNPTRARTTARMTAAHET